MRVNTASGICLLVLAHMGIACAGIDSAGLQGNILGKWKLLSRKDTVHNTINLAHVSPIKTIIFQRCKDTRELRDFPPFVRKLRKGNVFKDIRLIEYDTLNRAVDTTYPEGQFRGGDYLAITSYGKKYKKDYAITFLANDSLMIDASDLYLKEKPATPANAPLPKTPPPKTVPPTQ